MSISPYLQLEVNQQRLIAKELRDTPTHKTTFSIDLLPALRLIKGEVTEVGETARVLAKAMNAKAEEVLGSLDFEKNYQPWKQEMDVLTGLFPIANGVAKGMMFSGLAIGALSLWSFKSSKYLAAANGCAALALLIFSDALKKYTLGLHSHHKVINGLAIGNRRDFSAAIDGNYEAVEKNSIVLRYYFGARKQALTAGEHQGLQLLREDLSAIKEIKSYHLWVFSWLQRGTLLSMDSEESMDLSRIKSFFEKLERTLHQGKKLMALGTFIGLGYLYCAYVSRAYLMVIAGLTFSLMNGVLCGVAHSYEIGVAKIREADEDNLLPLFNSHVAGKLTPKTENTIAMQQAIVIPLERILKLIPV